MHVESVERGDSDRDTSWFFEEWDKQDRQVLHVGRTTQDASECAPVNQSAELSRLVVSLTPDAARILDRRSQGGATNKSTAICRALAVYDVVAAAWDAGGTAHVVREDGSKHRLALVDTSDEPVTHQIAAALILDPELLHPAACRCLGSSNDATCPMRWRAHDDEVAR